MRDGRGRGAPAQRRGDLPSGGLHRADSERLRRAPGGRVRHSVGHHRVADHARRESDHSDPAHPVLGDGSQRADAGERPLPPHLCPSARAGADRRGAEGDSGPKALSMVRALGGLCVHRPGLHRLLWRRLARGAGGGRGGRTAVSGDGGSEKAVRGQRVPPAAGRGGDRGADAAGRATGSWSCARTRWSSATSCC